MNYITDRPRRSPEKKIIKNRRNNIFSYTYNNDTNRYMLSINPCFAILLSLMLTLFFGYFFKYCSIHKIKKS